MWTAIGGCDVLGAAAGRQDVSICVRQLEKILKFLCGDPECVIGTAVDNGGCSIIVPARIAGNVGVFHEASERADLLLKSGNRCVKVGRLDGNVRGVDDFFRDVRSTPCDSGLPAGASSASAVSSKLISPIAPPISVCHWCFCLRLFGGGIARVGIVLGVGKISGRRGHGRVFARGTAG